VLTLTDAQGQPVSDATVTLRADMQIMNMGEISATIQSHSGSGVYVAVFKVGQTLNMEGLWTLQAGIIWPGHTSVQMTFQVTITS
jgi:hypothetical protein